MDIPSTSLSNNVVMPLLGIGTTHSGGYYHDVIIFALENGYRLIDTARRYGVETELGIAWQKSRVPREDLFLCSKLWPTDFGKTVSDAFAASCSRLQTNYLEDLSKLMETSSVTPHVNQCEMHPWYNPKELRSFCEENNILFTGYCPMAKGRYLDDPLLNSIADRHNKTPAQVCLRWSVQQGVPVIPKSTSKKRTLENMKIFDFNLTSEELLQLNTLSTIPHKVVTFETLEETLKLPDGYKLKGRIFGVPCQSPSLRSSVIPHQLAN